MKFSFELLYVLFIWEAQLYQTLCISSYIHRRLELGFKWEPLLSLTHFSVVWISDECPWLVSPRFFKALSKEIDGTDLAVRCMLNFINISFDVDVSISIEDFSSENSVYFPSKIENWKSILMSREVLLGLFDGGVRPSSPNSDPDFRPLSFSTLASKIHSRFQNWQKQKSCYHYSD